MERFVQDLNELNQLRKLNFNKMDSFFKIFNDQYKNRIDIKYLKLINDLEDKINNAPQPLLNIGFKEYYNRLIEFPEFNNNFFSLVWDIEKAESIIKKNKLKATKIRANDLLPFVDVKNLNPVKVKEVKKNRKTNPVILATYSPMNTAILIDGNHRVFSKGNTSDSLDVYILNDFLSLDSMAGDIFRYLFVVHFNVTKIINFYESNAKKFNLDEVLIDIK